MAVNVHIRLWICYMLRISIIHQHDCRQPMKGSRSWFAFSVISVRHYVVWHTTNRHKTARTYSRDNDIVFAFTSGMRSSWVFKQINRNPLRQWKCMRIWYILLSVLSPMFFNGLPSQFHKISSIWPILFTFPPGVKVWICWYHDFRYIG